MATKDETLTENDDDLEIVEVDTPAGQEAEAAAAAEKSAKEKEDKPDPIVETPDDDDDDHEDARLAERDADPEVAEQKKLERTNRRQRQKEARNRTENELRELRHNYGELLKRVGNVESSTLSVNEGMVSAKLEEVRRDIATADSLLADAVKNADGDTYAQAMRLRDEAKSQEADLIVAQKAFKEKPATETADTTEATRLASEWKRANGAWYGINMGATTAANTIDAALSAENRYSHGSPEYYRELTRRVTEHFKSSETRDRPAAETTTDGRRKGPPIGDRGGGQNGNGSPRRVFLSKDRVDAIKAAGDWDDPVERAKAIKAYEQYDREQSANR